VLKRKRPPQTLNSRDRIFGTALRWSRWNDVLVIVKPETVVGWQRAGFRLYLRWSRPKRGQPRITEEMRALIRCLTERLRTGAPPKVHEELWKTRHRRLRKKCRPICASHSALG